MDDLIAEIYAAALSSQGWEQLLQRVADRLGARGGVMVATRTDDPPFWLTSPGFAKDMDAFVVEGWIGDPEYAEPLFRSDHPGFSVPTDHYTIDALHAVPVYATFMRPRGLISAAATIVQAPETRSPRYRSKVLDLIERPARPCPHSTPCGPISQGRLVSPPISS